MIISVYKNALRDHAGLFHVVVLGRISTPHQPLTNIDAGYRYAKERFLELYRGYEDRLDFKYFGEQASGLLIDRETIVAAENEIIAGRAHAVLMEDVSKSFRNPEHIYRFVYMCVDRDIRVIAPGDSLDTWDENWEVILNNAVARHGSLIPDTRRRIRRTSSNTFDMGGMASQVRSGYRKLSKDEANSGAYGTRGLRIAKLPEYTEIFTKVRELAVREHKGGTQIAAWLNEEEVPPGPYVKGEKWTKNLVINLLRDPILWGLREYPKQRYDPLFQRKGKAKYKRRRNPEPKQKHYPELAHMTRAEFEEMNAALDKLNRGQASRLGPKHPRYQVPRESSICPLQHARCIVCKFFVYSNGVDVRKCQKTKTDSLPRCWNRVQLSCRLTQAKLIDILIERGSRHPLFLTSLLDASWTQIERDRRRSHQSLGALEKQIKDLEAESGRLAKAIATGGKLKPLVTELKEVTKKLNTSQNRLNAIRRAEAKEGSASSRQELEIDPRHSLIELARHSFEFSHLMRRIFTEFWIQPVQALDSGQVRPRAILTLDLNPLVMSSVHADPTQIAVEHYVVELFDPPEHIKHMPAILALQKAKQERGEKASLKILAKELKIGHMTVKRALSYAKLMRAAGLTEPYRVLTQEPASASRWKSRKPSVEQITPDLGTMAEKTRAEKGEPEPHDPSAVQHAPASA